MNIHYVIGYAVGGVATLFMRGFNCPTATVEEGVAYDWVRLLLWPLGFAPAVAGFGAAVRGAFRGN